MDYIQDRNWGCRIAEYVFRGMRAVSLENELLRVTVLADKGTDVYEFLYKPLDLDLMYRSPFVLRNPALFGASAPNGVGAFHDNYHGGWQEILPTGGSPTRVKGAEFGYHGEVALIPWDYSVLGDDPECVEILFKTRTYRTPFYIEKTLRLERHRAALMIRERLVNEGMEEMSLMWGHHPAIGRNFIEEGCRIDLPPCRVYAQKICHTSRLGDTDGADWPIIETKDGPVDLGIVPSRDMQSHDVCFLYDLKDGWYAVRNPRLKLGFGMRWSKEAWPYLWFWQVYGGAFGYGFYGRSYHLALEPFSSYPDSYEAAGQKGTLLYMRPGECREARLTATVFGESGKVNGIGFDGKAT
jgi:galactose mutarotase-like enzyme